MLTEREERCPRCSTEAWCKWDASWYQNSLTRISIGQNRMARRFTEVFALASVVFILASLFVKSRANPTLEAQDLLFFPLVLGFCTYEIWAYAHGWTTSIDRYSHEGRPGKTAMRTFGLVLDVTAYVTVAFMFLKKCCPA
jgi:hypothetical protein